MQSRIISEMLLSLLIIGTLAFSFNIHTVGASMIIYIRADGSIEPDTAPISSIDNVTYHQTDDVSDNEIVVQRDNIVIDGAGYTVWGPESGIGITLSGRSNVTIRNMKFYKFSYHILLNMSSDIVIFGNTIRKTMDLGYGIYLNSSSNNLISGNNLWPLQETEFILNGIHLYNSSNNIISENDLYNEWWFGIVLYYSSNNTISGNNIRDNEGHGIYIDGSNNTIYGNDVKANQQGGIGLGGNCNRIFGNRVADNGWAGIRLSGSSNTIYGNDVINNDFAGIDLRYYSNYNRISGNTVTANKNDGIWLDDSSNNTINGNTVTANKRYGVWLRESSNNSVYHNNFVDNSEQVYSEVSTNVWDDGYPSGGNYWSNYTDVDLLGGPYQNETGSDGIGDTSYTIDTNNQDHYPLMGMFSDFNATSEHHVQTICNSSISDFQFNGTAINFNVTGEDDTTGFCRICIPTALMNETYRVFVNGTEILPAPLPLPCSNSTHNYLYFNYAHSTQEVMIIPENIRLIFGFSAILISVACVLLHGDTCARIRKRKTQNS